MRYLAAIALGFALIVVTSGTVRAKDWYPLEIDVWDPPFNTELQRSGDTYVPLETAARPWKICVSIPHLKDAYWVAVNFALVDEARRLGVRLRINEAGGYDKLEVHRRQIESCMATGADGLIVSGISADGLNDLVAGYAADGKHLLKVTEGQPTKVLWFPGPKGPGWTAAGDQGFNDALDGSQIEILETGWGDTGRVAQGALIEAALDRHSDVDFIVGTTVSAEAAVDILRNRGLSREIQVMSYYYGPGVHTGIRRGHIIAAPTDKQGLQARVAVDTIVRALEDTPFLQHVSPKVEVVDRETMRSFDGTTSIPPRGFRPIFGVDDWVTD